MVATRGTTRPGPKQHRGRKGIEGRRPATNRAMQPNNNTQSQRLPGFLHATIRLQSQSPSPSPSPSKHTSLARNRSSPSQRAVGRLLTQRHAVKLVEQSAPVVGQHLGVLDPLLRPVLVPTRHMVLGVLEVDELVADALLDEDGPVVLVYDGFLVLRQVSEMRFVTRLRLPGCQAAIP